jgi:hypothetical protein
VDIFNPEGEQKWQFLDHLPPLLELNENNIFFFVKMRQKSCKKQQKKVPDQLLVCEIGDL